DRSIRTRVDHSVKAPCHDISPHGLARCEIKLLTVWQDQLDMVRPSLTRKLGADLTGAAGDKNSEPSCHLRLPQASSACHRTQTDCRTAPRPDVWCPFHSAWARLRPA